jgi:molybdate transport system regulatory protein
MTPSKKHTPSCKVWIEIDGRPLLGKGGAEILEGVGSEKSLTKAAEKLGMSYRYVWNYIQKIERAIGESIVETRKGGKNGGGGAKLTSLGVNLLKEYNQLESALNNSLVTTQILDKTLNDSFNLRGKIISVGQNAATGTKVGIKVEATQLFLQIAKHSFEDMNLKIGDEVTLAADSTGIRIAK